MALPLLFPLSFQSHSSRLEPPAQVLPFVTMQFVNPRVIPDFDKDILAPLREAQVRRAVEEARLTALAAAEAVRVAQEQALAAQAVQTAPVRSSAPVTTADGNATMAAIGISPSDYGFVQFIVAHEGHWDPCVVNGGAHDCSYAVSGGQRAYGVCQSLPGSKMASAGADWATNAVTQLAWCNSYAVGRYGSWANAYAFWIAHNWW